MKKIRKKGLTIANCCGNICEHLRERAAESGPGAQVKGRKTPISRENGRRKKVPKKVKKVLDKRSRMW